MNEFEQLVGLFVAPSDAVATTSVLRPLQPPHRLLAILESESLLNDASALLNCRQARGRRPRLVDALLS